MKNATIWGILLLLLAPLAFGAELTSLTLHAPNIQQGEEITLSYTLVDDNTIGSVTTDVFLSGSINHRTTRYASGTRYEHTQSFVLPQSHDGNDEVRVRIDVADQFPILATIPLNPQTQQEPRIRNIAEYSNEDIVVVVDPVRDILQGENVYYRAQIYNTGNDDQVVTIGLSDVGNWATYRVDPQPTVRIPADSVHEAYIYLKVDEDAPPGITYFDVTARYDGQIRSEGVKIAVLQPIDTNPLEDYRTWIIAIALIILVLALIYVLFTQTRNKDDKGGDDDDFITYY